MEKITELQLNFVKDRLKEKGVDLAWEANALKYLAEKGYDVTFGARPLKRLIQKEVVNLFANALLEGTLHSGMKITLKKAPDNDFLTFE